MGTSEIRGTPDNISSQKKVLGSALQHRTLEPLASVGSQRWENLSKPDRLICGSEGEPDESNIKAGNLLLESNVRVQTAPLRCTWRPTFVSPKVRRRVIKTSSVQKVPMTPRSRECASALPKLAAWMRLLLFWCYSAAKGNLSGYVC